MIRKLQPLNRQDLTYQVLIIMSILIHGRLIRTPRFESQNWRDKHTLTCQRVILITHLYKYFAPLLNYIGLMFQVVFGGLTDVYLHALLRQTHIQKTTAKAEYWITSSICPETYSNCQRKVKIFNLLDSKMRVHSGFSAIMGMNISLQTPSFIISFSLLNKFFHKTWN